MAHRTKAEIKLKALRAAAGVALFTGALACSTTEPDVLTAQRLDPVDQSTVDAGFVDAGTPDAGFADAGFTGCDRDTMTPDDYIACCEAIGWDWNRGCAAWGPPAPPAMEIA